MADRPRLPFSPSTPAATATTPLLPACLPVRLPARLPACASRRKNFLSRVFPLAVSRRVINGGTFPFPRPRPCPRLSFAVNARTAAADSTTPKDVLAFYDFQNLRLPSFFFLSFFSCDLMVVLTFHVLTAPSTIFPPPPKKGKFVTRDLCHDLCERL